jgi:hypothetical protein
MISIKRNIIKFFYFTFSPRPRIFWWSIKNRQGYEKENFGDILTPYLVKRLSKKDPLFFEVKSKFSKYFKHYIMIGSIISYANVKSVVWGAGIIKKNQKIKNATFLAVRGPLTQQRLRDLGYKAPSAMGDPALLMPLVYNPEKKKIYKYGIIPHYIEEDLVLAMFKDHPDIKIISLLTNDIESVIDKIVSCEYIISTSLHGIIIAHCYGIPARWGKLSDRLSGDGTKFLDYFLSVELTSPSIDIANFSKDEFVKIDFHIPTSSIIIERQKDLLSSYPLNLDKAFKLN